MGAKAVVDARTWFCDSCTFNIFRSHIRTECEVCRTFGYAQHEFKFHCTRCGREGKCKFDPRIRQWKDKKQFGKKSKKSRYDKEIFAWGLLYLTISYYGLKHMSLEELLGDGSQGMITRRATPSCQTRPNTYRIIMDHPSVWHCTSHYISVHHCTIVPWQFRDVEYRWLRLRWILACIAVKHGLWSSWFTAPNGVLATPRFFRCWPVIKLSDLVVFTKKCSWFLHILPSSIIIYHGLPMFTMVYYPGWNRKSLKKRPSNHCRCHESASSCLVQRKKSCGQMWPPETGWNWIQRNESGTVVFINDIQDDTTYIKIRY